MQGAAFNLSKIGAALLFFHMSFSYLLATQFPTPQPQIDYPRALVQDTQQFQADGVTRAYIFEDQEILGFNAVVQSVYQSGMRQNFPFSTQVPTSPISYIRVAAYMLNSLAANTARLSGILQILDVKLSMKDATAGLQKQAATWLELDDNTGAFAIIEQVQFGDDASLKDRFWREVQRRSFLGVC